MALLLGVLAATNQWNPWLWVPALVFMLIGLVGDRLTEVTTIVFGFKMVARRVASEAKRIVGAPHVAGSGAVVAPAVQVSGTGRVIHRTVEENLTLSDEATASAVVVRPDTAVAKARAFDPTVMTESFTMDAVIAAQEALEQVSTPEELADRLVDYVRKADRSRLVTDLAALAPNELEALMRSVRSPGDET